MKSSKDTQQTLPAFNPAFDVTPAQLVTGIITEQGIAHDARSLSELIARQSAPRGIQS